MSLEKQNLFLKKDAKLGQEGAGACQGPDEQLQLGSLTDSELNYIAGGVNNPSDQPNLPNKPDMR